MRRSSWLTAGFMSIAIAAPAGAAERVFVGGYGGGMPVSFADLDGSGGGDLFTDDPDNETFGIGIDAAAGRLYYAEDSGNRIAFADLDGSGGGPLNTTGATVDNPEGFGIDPVGRKVYWSNVSGNKISFARLDGTGGGDLNTTGATVNRPNGIALDLAAGRIYWPNSANNTISFARLDNTGGGGELATGTTPDIPIGVAIDAASGRIYWANSSAGTIGFARLDGTGGGSVSTAGATPSATIYGVALDHAANRIYWAGYSQSKISFANLDGSGAGGDLNTTGATLDGPAMPALLKAPAPGAAPAVTGATTPGSVLSCSQGTWAPDDVGAFLFRVPQGFAYQWSLNGTDIAGATGSTYSTFASGDYRCTVTASNAAGAATQTSAPFTVAAPPLPLKKPDLSALKASRKTFTVKRGTVFSFRLDQPATVTIVIRKATGHKTKVQTLRRSEKAGLNKLTFHGRVRGKPFKPGRYRATFTPSASAGAGTPKSLLFRIARR